MGSQAIKSFYQGEIQKSLDVIFAEFEKRTGLSFTRDISELGAFATDKIEFDAKGPNNVGIYIAGKFDAEKIFTELEKEKLPNGLKIENRGDLKILRHEKFSLSVINGEFLLLASNDVINDMADKKFETSQPGAELKNLLEKSAIFLQVSISGGIKKILQTDDFLSKLPANLKTSVEKLESLKLFNDGLCISIEQTFSDEKTADEFKKLLESFKGMAELMISTQMREIDDKIKNTASVFEIMKPTISDKKTGLSILKETLGFVKIEANGKTSIIKIEIPKEYAEFIKPEALPVIIAVGGVVMAIAVPNFKKARENSHRKMNSNETK